MGTIDEMGAALPTISVNVTTFNRAQLLARCLDSVLRQSWPALELVVVDDASTDETAEVVERYRTKLPSLRYLRHERNRGNAAARNSALEACSGPYVAFLDDDDEWIDPKKLEKQMALLGAPEAEGVALVCSSVRLVREDGSHEDKIVHAPRDLTETILRGNGIIYSPTVLTRRSTMVRAGGFDTRLARGVDSEYYRTCIVRLGMDVRFLADVTTAVHEYGLNRLSPQGDRQASRRALEAHAHLLAKYWKEYLTHPRAAGRRVRSLVEAAWQVGTGPGGREVA